MGTDAGGGRAEDAGAGDAFEGLVLDEDFVRGATVKEPSARAKMLAERWRNEPPEAQPFRALPPPPEARSPHRARRWVLGTIAALIVSGLVVVVFARDRVDAVLGSTAPAAAAPAAPARPTGAIDPARPFAGSPAESYAEGAAGIMLPPALDVEGFTAAEVSAAMKQAKAYLVASRLDPRVVSGGAVDPVLRLLDPAGPRLGAQAALARPSEKDAPVSFLTRFDPATHEPVGSVVKVRGTVTYRAASPDELVVRTDHLFVHAVQRRGRPDTAQRVVVRVVAEFGTFRGRRTTPGTVWPVAYSTSAAGVDCGPSAFLRPSAGADVAGPGRDPYAQEPVDPGANPGCRPVTRL